MQSLQNLKNQQVYFGSPLGFNDPYDCALSPSVRVPSDKDIEAIRQYYLTDDSVDTKNKNALRSSSTQKLRVDFLRSAQTVLDGTIEEFLKGRGITCFTESNNNLLMWSHYGGYGKGFCLEFDGRAELFQKARRVRYSATMPKLDLVQLLCGDSSDQILDLYCTKGLDWRYEREWRCIHNVAGTPYGYPSSALTAIYLGPDIADSALEIIALILRGQNAHIRIMRGTRSRSEFSVYFNEITYTTHLEASNSRSVELTPI